MRRAGLSEEKIGVGKDRVAYAETEHIALGTKPNFE